jgi:hypothetical protein
MKGTKLDAGKAPLHLIPPDVLVEEARVMGFGEGKYGTYNWLGGMAWSRLVGATLRHVLAWHSGEDYDPETGLSHLAHARCCLGMLMGYQAHCLGLDDRFSAAIKRVQDAEDTKKDDVKKDSVQ